MPFPLDEKYINQVESKLGAKFPNQFRSKMMKQNGGELEIGNQRWWLFPFFDTSDRKRLKRTSNHILKETETARGWPNFPIAAVAIGENDSGDILVLLKDDALSCFQETVYWWNHTTTETLSTGKSIPSLFK